MRDSNTGGGRPGSAETASDNLITGGVSGTSVQAGTIHGGVHFHHATPAVDVVPRQLAAPPTHFVGREAELAELDRIAGDGHPRNGPAVAVISGQGGVGKSALALHWLHRRAARFPDGQLYADLTAERAEGSQLMNSVLGGFLRALGVSGERIPLDLGETAALFRSLTADKRIAVLVDNAASAAQVRTLSPASPTSTVVVTTRWRLGGLAMDGAGVVLLTPFRTEAGTELLARAMGFARVAREPDAAVRLVELCGGLPIALSIVGARLTTRPNWSVARMVHGLVDEQRRLSALTMGQDISVHGVFDLSYDGLSEEESRAYRLLGLHPGPHFRAELAAAVLQRPGMDAFDLLENLVDASLLEIAGTDRYRYHDLVRLHAREQATREESDEERTAVLRRVLDHYLRFAVEADVVVNPLERRIGPAFEHREAAGTNYDSGEAALADLELELPNLMTALHAGVEHELDDLVWQLCEAMYSLFLYHKHFEQWITTYRLGIVAASRCGDDAARSRMHHHLGLAFHNLGRPDEAAAEGTEALAAARAAGHGGAETEALQLIGMADRARGRYDAAVEVLTEAVELDAEAGRLRDEALARRRLGQTLVAAGRVDEAIGQLRVARTQASRLADAHVEANTTVWLADALVRRGRAEEAIDLIEKAWQVLRKSGSRQYHAQVLMVWGEAAERQGDLVTATARLQQARDLYAELGAPHVARAQNALDRVGSRLSQQAGGS